MQGIGTVALDESPHPSNPQPLTPPPTHTALPCPQVSLNYPDSLSNGLDGKAIFNRP